MVGPQPGTVLGGEHRQVGIAGEDIGQMTVAIRCQMGQHDADEARLPRHAREELLERLQPTGRSTDGDDRTKSIRHRSAPFGRAAPRQDCEPRGSPD